MAAAPKAAQIRFAAIDPFATPFHQCFAKNARRLDWRGGIAPLFLSHILAENPGAEVNRMLPVGTFRRPQPGQSFMVVDILWSPHIGGEYQFVLLNQWNGRVFGSLPPADDPGCAMDGPKECAVLEHYNFVLDGDSARAAFGEPKEEIDCAGIGLFHYDPPLKFDFSHLKDPYLAPVARW